MKNRLRHSFQDQLCGGLINTGCQDIGADRGHAGEDLCRLLGGFARSVNHLRKSRPQSAVMVDARMADIFKWQMRQAIQSSLDAQLAAFD
jgi:hypothetical protein